VSVTSEIRNFALDLGYSRVGITTAEPFEQHLEEVRSRGDSYNFYMNTHRAGAWDIRSRMPDARSIIVLVWDYFRTAFPENLLGSVGRLYQARCYQAPADRINGARFRLMKEFLAGKGCQVQDLYIPERPAAARAGVTRFGRNTFACADGTGSFILLSSLVVDIELEYDTPNTDTHCPPGCDACMKACPTGAIFAPFKMDPCRCLSFNAWMTQESKVPGISRYIPRDIRDRMGIRVHGCDICQEVCPRNQAKMEASLPDDAFLETIAPQFSLKKMLTMTDEFYETVVRPIMYNYITDRSIFRRNAAVALGNLADPDYVPDLARAMEDEDESVRAHAAWALGKIGGSAARRCLETARRTETSTEVREEIDAALFGEFAEPVTGTPACETPGG
jgi:epoxyqueuosine reductase